MAGTWMTKMCGRSLQLGCFACIAACSAEGTLDIDRSDPAMERQAELVDQQRRVAASPQTACDGTMLPSCNPGETGPSCSWSCIGNELECSFSQTCHADGRVHGMRTSRAFMFDLDPTGDDRQVHGKFLDWIVGAPGDLGLASGLQTSDLGLWQDSPFRHQHDWLTFFRFRQQYRGLPVHGPDALVQLEAHPYGALSFSGAIVDGRPTYDGLSSRSTESHAKSSATHHVANETSIPQAELSADHAVRVAVPEWERICWRVVVYHGGVQRGMVLLGTEPPPTGGPLPLLHYDTLSHEALEDTVPIELVGEDPESVIDHIELTKTMGYSTKLLDELSTGAPLLGSTVHPDADPPGEPPQLATERVVALDLMDNEPEEDPASGEVQFPAFLRITDPNGEFHDGTGTHRFHVQRTYWKAQSAFDLVHAYMEGRWDSARPYFGEPSLMPPGTFIPRIFVAYRGFKALCTSGSACAGMGFHPTLFPGSFPVHELRQLPPGSTKDEDAEVIASIGLQAGGQKANVLLHEFGHTMDVFLGAGYAQVAQCPDPCTDTTCDEDTPDEAPALTETIAQLWTLVFIRHLYPIDYEDACPLIGNLFPSPTSTRKVHGPSCTTAVSEVHLMIRADSQDCPYQSPTQITCDKPFIADNHHCSHQDGYRVASLMQAFWELANGRRCDPEPPFECEALPVWPPDCESDPQTECATPLDLLIPAFAYAQRLRPTTYRQFVDDFVRYVACNYGDVMYAEVNAVLCHHGATDCTAPPPTECAECGNEVREGGEECDGQDWIPNVSCEAFGFDGGQLACDQQTCELDLSGCYHDPMTSGSGTDGSASGGLDETGTSLSGGGDDGGGDGCGCAAGPRGGPGLLVGLIALLGLRRRRARGTLGAIALFVGAGACGDDVTTTSATTTAGAGSTEDTSTGEVASLPPEAWVGYYRRGWSYEGEPMSRTWPGRWLELEIRDDGTCLYSTVSCTSTEPEWTRVYECLFHDGFVRMRNFDGSPVTNESHIYKDFHFGTECGVLHEYLVRDPDEYPYPEDPWDSSWYRGRLCVVETCPEDAFDDLDDLLLDEPWVYDLCPGEPTDCPCLETATACPEVEASP